jgi:RHS repeat-associated protein
MYYSGAYAPFGETYAEAGTPDRSFTGQNQDTVQGSTTGLYDFLYREHAQYGRWISPDPAGLAAVSLADPQSWNRYAYVRNSPLTSVDPFGLRCVEAIDGSDPRPYFGCGGGGFALRLSLMDAMGLFDGRYGGDCGLENVPAPCNMVQTLLAQGQAVQCPNNVCLPGMSIDQNGNVTLPSSVKLLQCEDPGNSNTCQIVTASEGKISQVPSSLLVLMARPTPWSPQQVAERMKAARPQRVTPPPVPRTLPEQPPIVVPPEEQVPLPWWMWVLKFIDSLKGGTLIDVPIIFIDPRPPCSPGTSCPFRGDGRG